MPNTRITHNLPGSSILFGERIEAMVREAAAEGLNDHAKFILEHARKDAPIGPALRDDRGRFRHAEYPGEHPGYLRRSGKIDYRATTRRLWAEVGFHTPYAADQHETLWYHHDQGGRAKYLSAWLFAYAGQADLWFSVKIKEKFGITSHRLYD